MLASEREQLKAEINKMAKKFDYHRSGLIPVLQYVQNISRHISPESMQDIAEAFKIHPVEVQGVVSFYSFLSIERKGKFVVRLCRTNHRRWHVHP
jgi:NADH:ubiquinone oxidoreductase subunit E